VVGDVTVYVVAERVQYYGNDGKLITESLKDYTRKAVRNEYTSLDQFLRRWTNAEKKQVIIDELRQQGILLEALSEEVGKEIGKDCDAFDLICHVAFDKPPLSRRERAEQVKKRNYFTKYGAEARRVLEALLDKYADTGIENIESMPYRFAGCVL
jgi:type I restriction enzyme R subunit